MNMEAARTIAIVLMLAALSGCASITRGTTEAYAIETIPPGATASLSNGLTCTTPCSLKVKRRGDFVVTIERDGYEPVTASITSSVDGAGAAGMAGNVLIGGLIGAGIDAGTGAMHSHKPNPLRVTMVPNDAPPGTEAVTNIVPPDEDSDESGEGEENVAEKVEADGVGSSPETGPVPSEKKAAN